MKKLLRLPQAPAFARARARLATSTVPRGTLEILLPRGWPEEQGAIHWRLHSTGGEEHGKVRALNQLPGAAHGARVHVWTPGTETVLTTARVPTRSRAKTIQALPYALEDQLVEEPEKLHFAYVRQPSDELAVAITARSRVIAWTDALKQARLRPEAFVPAMLVVPHVPDGWSIAFFEDEMWVRSGAYAGFACLARLDAPPPLLAAALIETQKQNATPKRLVFHRPPPAFAVDTWRARLGVPIEVNDQDVWTGRSPRGPVLSLLQGDFAPAGEVKQLSRRLLPAAALLAVWLAGALIVDVVEWLRLRHLDQKYTAEMQAIYASAFPGGGAVVDPAAQMQRRIETLAGRGDGPGDLLPLLTRVAATLQSGPQVRLQGIKYGERSLTVDLTVPDYQALETIKNGFKQASLDVEVLGANRRENNVEGRLRVQPIGARKPPRQTS